MSKVTDPERDAPANDDGLIALCDQHAATVAALNSAPYGRAEAEYLRLMGEYERTRDLLTKARPATFRGMAAIAKVAKIEALILAGDEASEHGPALDWAWNLVQMIARWTSTSRLGAAVAAPVQGVLNHE